MNTARFESFSDGVFAFAITLLILGIALPEFKNGRRGGAIVGLDRLRGGSAWNRSQRFTSWS